jgi:hypothetical protein
MDTVVRTYTPPVPQETLPEPETNKVGAETNPEDIEPVDLMESRGIDVTLEALGIDDQIENLPEESQENLKEVRGYVLDILKQRGVTPTKTSFKQTLDSLKWEMGLDPDADPEVVLDRIGGVVKSWKELSFIRDPKEKRVLFMRLARAQSSSEMNKLVFEEMEKKKIWL